jgi:hypothetical protein
MTPAPSLNLFVLSGVICGTMLFVCAAKLREIVAAALLGATLGVLFRIPTKELYVQAMIWLAWWGIGGFLITMAGICVTPTGRRDRMLLVRRMAFLPLFDLLGNFLVTITIKLTPFTFDRFLYAADGSFGFQPGFAAAAMLVRRAWLLFPCEVVYVNLPVLAVALYLLVDRRHPSDGARVVRLLAAFGIAGACMYYFFPAVGSDIVFGSNFPFHPPDSASLKLEPIRLEFGSRNLMPSLHTAWCLAICWSARGLTRVWRMTLAPLVALTLVYTLSRHYFVDMVAAIPFTLAVYSLVEERMPWNHPARRLAFCSGAVCFAAWLIALRFGTALFLVSPVIGWTASVLTVVLCWYCLYAEPGVGEVANPGRRISNETHKTRLMAPAHRA